MPLQAAGQPVLLTGVGGKEALEHCFGTATQTTQKQHKPRQAGAVANNSPVEQQVT